MGKLTKKQLHELELILSNIKRAYNYLQKENIVGLASSISDIQSNGADYKINNEDCLNTCLGAVKNIRLLDKEIGSDIAGLSTGVKMLNNFIVNNL